MPAFGVEELTAVGKMLWM